MATLTELLKNGLQTGFVTGPAMTAAIEKAVAEQQEQMAAKLVGLIGSLSASLKEEVILLRNYRQQANKQAEKVKTTTRALQYFGATGNPLPVFKALGETWRGDEFFKSAGMTQVDPSDSIWSVPADWTPDETIAE